MAEGSKSPLDMMDGKEIHDLNEGSPPINPLTIELPKRVDNNSNKSSRDAKIDEARSFIDDYWSDGVGSGNRDSRRM